MAKQVINNYLAFQWQLISDVCHDSLACIWKFTVRSSEHLLVDP